MRQFGQWLIVSALALAASVAPVAPAAHGQGSPPVQALPGPAALAVTDTLALGFRLRGAVLAGYSGFPDFEGFKKVGRRRTTTTRTVAGRTLAETTVLQRYVPYGEGEQPLPAFVLKVNGQPLRFAARTVRVGPPRPAPPPVATADLDQLFGKPKPALYQDLPDRAYLALEADRTRVYSGEGVRVGLYFYLRPADQALLAFHDFDDQLPRLFKRLRQPGAWEVPAPPAPPTPDTLRRAGQPYLRFRLAESTYYPLSARPLTFPPLALTMTKFRLLKKAEPGTDNRLATLKTYFAPGLSVTVLPLPAGAAVPVGDFRLLESNPGPVLPTGQAFTYSFGVEGRGNLAALLPPTFAPWPGLDVYGPDVVQTPAPGGGRKVFRYRLVARRPGPLPLPRLLRLVVFNPRTARYDTLRPTRRPVLQGPPAAPSQAATPADDPIFGPALANASTDLQPLDAYRTARRYAGWLLAGLGALAVGGALRRWR